MNNKQQDSSQQVHPQQHTPQTPSTPSSHSWWSSPLVGYPLAILFTAVAFLIPLAVRYLTIPDLFIEPPFVIAMLLVGWIWGTGPALLALVIEVIALDYWIVPPLGSIDFFRWPDIVSFASFIIIQLIILRLIVFQKKYRQQLLLANQDAFKQAQELAESNSALIESNVRLIESNARLDQANHVKDQFLSLASHELKTPITAIQGQTQLALRRLARQQPLPTDFASLPDSLAKVEAQTHRLHTLVNDLLNLSSLRSGKMPLRVGNCDFSRLCQSVVEDQRALTDRLIQLKLPPNPVEFQADEGRLAQVVINLVVNAIKYSPACSVIAIDVSQNTTRVNLKIHNDGPAIPKELQEKIFEPFYRAPEAQKSTTQGWGLGLAISKEIIEQHGGNMWVESFEGTGTSFIVTLPLQNVSQEK